MEEISDGDVGAMMAALLRECAAFETGLTDVRETALRGQLMRLTHGQMTDSEFKSMLGAPSIVKPECFLSVLEAVGNSLIPTSKILLEEAFENILSADGPPSEGAAELMDKIRISLMY